jgi:glycosyltransferase involved in cell wall biosynthesis
MQNKKIIFHDTANDGHRFIYNYTVMSNLIEDKDYEKYYYSPLDNDVQKSELNRSLIKTVYAKLKGFKNKNFLYRLKELLELNKYCNRNKIDRIHFFNLDSVIIPLFILYPIFFNKKITGTLHWFPSRLFKQKSLQLLLKINAIRSIVVHGKYTYNCFKSIINKDETNSINVINYPNFHENTSEVDKSLLNNFQRPIILAFGGTRFDKGIDILLQALNKLNEKEFTLVIAGKEEDFSRGHLEEMIINYGVKEKVVLNLGYVEDCQMVNYFSQSDIIVLPYRKIFTGQSGPLTEGVMNNKIIVGPSHGEIGATITNYGLGRIFNSEDINDLSFVLSNVIENYQVIKKDILINQESFKRLISKEGFIEKYQSYFFQNK